MVSMKVLHLLGMFVVCNASKVYDWRRDWGGGLVTVEMAQIQEGDQQIFHSNLDSTVDLNIASISMHDFKHESKRFKRV